MNRSLRLAATLVASASLLAACGPGATTAPTTAPPTTAPTTAATEAPTEGPATPIPGGLLDTILTAGKIRVSMDAAYPPQSELLPDGSFEGFDIDVATEIAMRLGVAVEFTPQEWDIITAGSWAGRWDVSVGSMTILPVRDEVLDFSLPYYFTPAQAAASTQSGITTLEGLAGKSVCVGAATTYFQWLEGTLDYGPGGKPAPPPAGITTVTRPTDRDCAVEWQQGRHDFEGWVSSSTTVAEAIGDGLPLVAVGDPVYSEPLAVATDQSGPETSDFLARLDEIITAMHADGTLTRLSERWFGEDLTKDPSL